MKQKTISQTVFLLSWRKFALILLAFIVFVFFHNLTFGLFRFEEPFFFLAAVFGIPLYLLLCAAYTLYYQLKHRSDKKK